MGEFPILQGHNPGLHLICLLQYRSRKLCFSIYTCASGMDDGCGLATTKIAYENECSSKRTPTTKDEISHLRTNRRLSNASQLPTYQFQWCLRPNKRASRRLCNQWSLWPNDRTDPRVHYFLFFCFTCVGGGGNDVNFDGCSE